MKLELNVEYILKDNKGYVMAIDQSTSFKTIINFVGDYQLDVIDVGLMYMLFQDNQAKPAHRAFCPYRLRRRQVCPRQAEL